jgi:hypothetical protein
LTLNTAATGGNIAVTGNVNNLPGAAGGIYQTGTITARNGSNISFTSNNNIDQGGVLTLAANTSGADANIIFDTTTGNINSTITTGNLTIGSATGGNLTGGNVISANTGIFVGNITSANLITGSGTGGSITGANLVSANYFSGNGSQLTGVVATVRTVTVTDATSITMNADTSDVVVQTNTQVAGTLTINAVTGTPINGQKIILRLQSANIQTFSWNAVFDGSTDTPLPTTSSGSNKYDYMGFMYNSLSVQWQMIAKNFGF